MAHLSRDTRRRPTVRLELTDEDAATLRALLHDYLPSLRREVARTEKREIRHEMERRQEVVERVLAGLGDSDGEWSESA
jgi:hypothetical protein